MPSSQTDYELIGSQPSYYTAKVRACLQYKRLPYEEIGSNFDAIGKKVIPLTGDHTFPVVICPDGAVLKDGCDIVEALDARSPARPVIPADPSLKLLATLIETLADEFFAMAAIYYRWGPADTREWALDMFSILSQKGVSDPSTIEFAGAMADKMATGIQARIAKVGLDRTDIQETCVRVVTRTCDLLDNHLAKTPFILGDRPCLADLGMMNALWGHLYLDPCDASTYIRRHCTHLSQWITNMHSAAGIPDRGELYLGEGLKSLLAFLGDVFGPMAKATLLAADKALPERAMGEPLERGMGKVETQFQNVELTRPTSAYTAWRLQRVIACYGEIPEHQRVETDRLLRETGFLAICQHQPAWRMEKREFKLYRVR